MVLGLKETMEFLLWLREEQRSIMAEILGITTADIKSVTAYWNRDRYVIRTWNRRKLELDGMEVERAMSNRRRRVRGSVRTEG